MNSLEYRARLYATNCHFNQRRKCTREHYIVHPAAVVDIVRSVPHTAEMLAAAWLHDTVEHTPTTVDDIRHFFGEEVASLVEMVTDVSRPEDGSKAKRRAIDLVHLSLASPAAKTIKIADVIDNARAIAVWDPSFAAVWLPEKREQLEMLRGGDAGLWRAARDSIEAKLKQLALPRTA
jgi:(p)ppGpp synthase/HD superfamily hydrolase